MESSLKVATLFVSSAQQNAAVRALDRAGMEVQQFTSVAALLHAARETGFDAAVLEASDDGLSKWIAALRMKGVGQLPIIVLGVVESALLANALRSGADDYVILHDDGEELVARVLAHVTQRVNTSRSANRKAAGCLLDARRMTVRRADKEVSLTAREFGIASLLLGAHGRTTSSDVLLGVVWGNSCSVGKRTLEQHIHNLRRKFAAAFGSELTIRVIHGVGYRLDVLVPVPAE
jgi:DNA-binding response OmpR family regulator